MAPKISYEDNVNLMRSFIREEFKEAIFQMQPDKDLVSDGFSPSFYQHFWSIYGEDVFLACQWIQQGEFPFSVNDINIVLIPKVDHPRGMKDFRPISLYNVVYKILAKVLTNRLSKVIDKCVSKEQYAFVLGRSIVDNALVASKIMHYFRLVNKFA